MLKVNSNLMQDRVSELEEIASQLESLSQAVTHVNSSLKWKVSGSTTVSKKLITQSENLCSIGQKATNLSAVLSNSISEYERTENGLCSTETESDLSSIKALIASGKISSFAGIAAIAGVLGWGQTGTGGGFRGSSFDFSEVVSLVGEIAEGTPTTCGGYVGNWDPFGAISSFIDDFKDDWDFVGSTLEDLSDLYNLLPEEVRDLADELYKLIPSDFRNAWSITYDVITGSIDKDTGYTLVSAVAGGTVGSAFKSATEYALEIMEKDAAYQKVTSELFSEGNICSGIVNMAVSFVDEIGTGVIDAGGSLLISTLNKIPGVELAQEKSGLILSDIWSESMDNFHEAATSAFGTVVDTVSKAEDAIQSTVSTGIKSIGSAIKGLFS